MQDDVFGTLRENQSQFNSAIEVEGKSYAFEGEMVKMTSPFPEIAALHNTEVD